jgi:hypothetical protein
VLSLSVSCDDDGDDELVVARWRLAEAADAGATQFAVEVLDPEWNCGVSVLRRMVSADVTERDDSIDLERGVGDREIVGATTSWP